MCQHGTQKFEMCTFIIKMKLEYNYNYTLPTMRVYQALISYIYIVFSFLLLSYVESLKWAYCYTTFMQFCDKSKIANS